MSEKCPLLFTETGDEISNFCQENCRTVWETATAAKVTNFDPDSTHSLNVEYSITPVASGEHGNRRYLVNYTSAVTDETISIEEGYFICTNT